MPLTSEQRDLIYLGVGGALVVGAFAFMGSARATSAVPATGVQINQDCSDWRVLDATKLESTLKTVYAKEVDAGVRNPWVISRAQMRRLAPHCRRYPTEPRSINEALLNYTLYKDNVDQMFLDGLVVEQEAEDLHAAGVLWARFYNIPQEYLHGED